MARSSMHSIRFPRERVMRLVEFTKQAKGHHPTYTPAQEFIDQMSKKEREAYEAEKAPGLHLVGDSGIYLMSNARDSLLSDGETVIPSGQDFPEGAKNFVIFADGISPRDDAYSEEKDRIFGGDDGAIHLPLETIEASLTIQTGKWFSMCLSPTEWTIETPVAKRPEYGNADWDPLQIIHKSKRLTNAHYAALDHVFPLDFPHWGLAAKDGTTPAHVAAQVGNLPAGFSQWSLANKKGQTVEQYARHFKGDAYVEKLKASSK